MRTLALGLVVLLAAVATARGQTSGPSAPPLNPHDFALMAWGASPSDPQQLARMREAGLNVSGFCRPQDLDKVRAAGLACFVTDPRANGYAWEKIPEEGTVKRNLASLEREVANHPAVLGFFLRDEPSVQFMPALGRVAKLLTEGMPGAWPYINLFPNGASPAQFGVASYDLYLRTYLDDVHPPFLSYDNYSLEHGMMLDRFYENLDVIRRLSLESKTPFWNTVTSVAHMVQMDPSDANLHLEAYASMAYGAKGIEYFTYFCGGRGNYRLAPVDPFGHRTPTWYMLRRINNEVRELAPTLVTLTSTGIYFSDPVPVGLQPLSASTLIESVNARSTHALPEAGLFLIGEFENRQGHPYFMLVNRDLDASMHFSLQLKNPHHHLFRISPYTGKEEAFGGEMDWLAPGAGILFRVE